MDTNYRQLKKLIYCMERHLDDPRSVALIAEALDYLPQDLRKAISAAATYCDEQQQEDA